ncbi:MAG: hypothetical protein II770_06035 [Bacteroidales bacterium]|nr:hypothetical protein [Bacteroidales bacterium]
MDALITYVDGNDPVWQEQYESCFHQKPLAKRYRDWGTLRYLLRGVETCMPFIDNVFLVVSSKSQVPSWVDTGNVRVVLHSDIMPSGSLPTFNSTSIEMFLHRAPGLGEEFIYFNDDMFPVSKCAPEDFFPDGRPAIAFTKCLFTGGMYRKQVRNSDLLARRALGMDGGLIYVRPQHICSPMLRSESEACFQAVKDEILSRLSPTRTVSNVNQYLFLDYLYYQVKAVNRKISNRHLSYAVHSVSRICDNILHPSTKLICINDVRLADGLYEKYKALVTRAFSERFPIKSRFEI